MILQWCVCVCVRARVRARASLPLPAGNNVIHPALSGRVRYASAPAVNPAPLVFTMSGVRFSAEGPSAQSCFVLFLLPACQNNGRCLKVSHVLFHVLNS
jgi:hypothetical protein